MLDRHTKYFKYQADGTIKVKVGEYAKTIAKKVKITGSVEGTVLPGDFSIQYKFNQHYQYHSRAQT